MALNFLLSAGLSLGSSFLLNLVGGGNKKPWTTNEWNKIEKFDEPQSRYGEPIYKIFGKVKVTGIYFACQIPPDWESDDNPNPVTRENLRTEIYYGNLGVLWASKIPLDNDPEIKKIWFNKLLYYQNGAIDATLGDYWIGWEGLSLNNHFGDQLSNDEFLNFQGFYNTPHHGMCVSAMHRLRLNNGPNSNDNLFNSSYPGLEAEIHTHTTATLYLSEVVKEICLDAGYSESELDVTELNAIEIGGYKCSVGSTSEKLKPLQLAYNFEIIDTGSQLKFIKQYRSTASAYIPLEALAAREDGQGRESLFVEKENIELKDLPTMIRVIFSDINKDYQPNSKDSYSLNLSGGKPNIETVYLGNLSLTETEALNIANRLLQLAHLRSKTYKITVLGRYCGLEAGDVVESPFRYGEITQYQIKDFNQGANGIIEIIGFPYDASIYNFSYTAAAANSTTATATQGSPISVGQTNIISVDSVTSSDGSITYVFGTDYTVNLGSGTITPIVDGGIANGSNPIIYWSGEAVPEAPPTPPVIPPPPTPETPPEYVTFDDLNEAIATKQDTLVSGTNIKSINGESLLGTGNIVISGGGSSLDLGTFYDLYPRNSTKVLFTCPFNYRLTELTGLKLASGTCTITIQIGGVNVTGLSNINVTTTPQTLTATALNIATVGQIITIIISNYSNASTLEFTLSASMFLFAVNKATLDYDNSVIYCSENISVFNTVSYNNSVIYCSENIDVFNTVTYDNSVIYCSEDITSISPP